MGLALSLALKMANISSIYSGKYHALSMHLCNFGESDQQMMTLKLVTSVKQFFKENIWKVTDHLGNFQGGQGVVLLDKLSPSKSLAQIRLNIPKIEPVFDLKVVHFAVTF